MLTLVASIYVLSVVPEFLVRFCLWLLTHTIYRIRIDGQEHVPSRGPALLVCNHLSHVDGALVGACIQRFVRFLVYKPYYEHWAVNPLLRMLHAIPVGSGREAVAAIKAARQELQDGHVVCIFAEGAISRTGNLLPFKRGLEKIVDGLDVPIVPVYLDRVWGSVFSFKGGRFLWKWPARFPYPVTVTFGAPLPASTPAAEVRVALMARRALGRRRCAAGGATCSAAQFIASAKRHWGSFCIADSGTPPLTYGRDARGAFCCCRAGSAGTRSGAAARRPAAAGVGRRRARQHRDGDRRQDVREPELHRGHVSAMTAAIERCGITTILTSRKFVAKAEIAPLDGMVFLEDVIAGFTPLAKARDARDGLRAARRGCCRGSMRTKGTPSRSRRSSSRAAAPACPRA